MRAHIITIVSLPESVAAAERCRASCAAFGLTAEIFPAITPEQAESSFASAGWPVHAFTHNPYSRPLPCMACFASHASLWSLCVYLGQPLIVMEHDAIMVRPLPDLTDTLCCVNLGKPSFGQWRQPKDGLQPLTSAGHFKGAHAYAIGPAAAAVFLARAKTTAEPTDVFLNRYRFPFLQEYHPWPFECRDEVTTIQRELGCKAKHNRVRII